MCGVLAVLPGNTIYCWEAIFGLGGLNGKASWKTWALAFLCNVFLEIEHVPYGSLKTSFSGCEKKQFLLFIMFPGPRAAAQTHVIVLSLQRGCPLEFQKSLHLNDFKDFHSNWQTVILSFILLKNYVSLMLGYSWSCPVNENLNLRPLIVDIWCGCCTHLGM